MQSLVRQSEYVQIGSDSASYERTPTRRYTLHGGIEVYQLQTNAIQRHTRHQLLWLLLQLRAASQLRLPVLRTRSGWGHYAVCKHAGLPERVRYEHSPERIPL